MVYDATRGKLAVRSTQLYGCGVVRSCAAKKLATGVPSLSKNSTEIILAR